MDTTSAARYPLVRTAGLLCVTGAVIGALGGIVLAVVPPAVGAARFSYPFTPGGFLVAQSVFILNHVLLLVGVLGLARSGVGGTGGLARSGLLVTAIGWVALTLCEIRAMTLATSPYPSPSTDVLDTAYGVATILIGVGLILAGVAVARARVWTGWHRFITLVSGVAVFLIVIPGIFGPFLAGRIVLIVWMLLLAALGWALYAEARRPVHAPMPATA